MKRSMVLRTSPCKLFDCGCVFSRRQRFTTMKGLAPGEIRTD